MRRLFRFTIAVFAWSLLLITVNLAIHQSKQPVSYWIGFLSSRTKRLTHEGTGNTAPAWSPDGNYIASVSERDGEIEIYRMRTDGAQKRHLTNSRGDNVYPTWSPPTPSPHLQLVSLLLLSAILLTPLRIFRVAAAVLILHPAQSVPTPPEHQ